MGGEHLTHLFEECWVVNYKRKFDLLRIALPVHLTPGECGEFAPEESNWISQEHPGAASVAPRVEMGWGRPVVYRDTVEVLHKATCKVRPRPGASVVSQKMLQCQPWRGKPTGFVTKKQRV